jgi:hypothetical protein
MITPAALADPLAGDRIAYRAGVEVKSVGVDNIDDLAAQPPQGEKPPIQLQAPAREHRLCADSEAPLHTKMPSAKEIAAIAGAIPQATPTPPQPRDEHDDGGEPS